MPGNGVMSASAISDSSLRNDNNNPLYHIRYGGLLLLCNSLYSLFIVLFVVPKDNGSYLHGHWI